MNRIDPTTIRFDKADGLVPAIVQHAESGSVLMLGFMNALALESTQNSGRVTFFSRRRQQLWTKGESSGHVLEVVDIAKDCDDDAVLVLARPRGPTCHRNTPSCFDPAPAPQFSFLAQLDALILTRERERPLGSYTSGLFDSGVRGIAQKVGEEAVETVLAAVTQDDAALCAESADLLFHLMVLLRSRSLGLTDVITQLRLRHNIALRNP